MARDVGDQHKAEAVRLCSSLARRRRNQTADIDETAVRQYARTHVRKHAGRRAWRAQAGAVGFTKRERWMPPINTLQERSGAVV